MWNRVALSAVTFDTSHFRFAHGRQPRGTGLWAFTGEGMTFTVSASFTEARRVARTFFAERGVRQVKVES